MPLEKDDERTFKRWIDGVGLWCLKINPFGFRGLPDRVVLGPNRFIVFLEFKRKRNRPSLQQISVHAKLRTWGFPVYVVYTPHEAFDKIRAHL